MICRIIPYLVYGKKALIECKIKQKSLTAETYVYSTSHISKGHMISRSVTGLLLLGIISIYNIFPGPY